MGRLGQVIPLVDFGALPLFVYQLLDGLEEVHAGTWQS